MNSHLRTTNVTIDSNTKIAQNALKVGGEIIVSSHRHDFVAFKLPDGSDAFIDGGADYLRWGGNIQAAIDKGEVESLVITEGMPLKDIAQKLLWITKAKDSGGAWKYVRLQDCETGHLEAILETQKQISRIYIAAIAFILGERYAK